MSLEAVHVWQSETLRDGKCCLCDMVRAFPSVLPSQPKKCATVGQLSCRDACQAYRSATSQAETLQQEHLSFFPLLLLATIIRGDWSAKNTAKKSHFPLCLASTSDFSPLLHSCQMKVTCPFSAKCETLFYQFFSSTKVTLYFTFNWWAVFSVRFSITYSGFCIIPVLNSSKVNLFCDAFPLSLIKIPHSWLQWIYRWHVKSVW